MRNHNERNWRLSPPKLWVGYTYTASRATSAFTADRDMQTKTRSVLPWFLPICLSAIISLVDGSFISNTYHFIYWFNLPTNSNLFVIYLPAFVDFLFLFFSSSFRSFYLIEIIDRSVDATQEKKIFLFPNKQSNEIKWPVSVCSV